MVSKREDTAFYVDISVTVVFNVTQARGEASGLLNSPLFGIDCIRSTKGALGPQARQRTEANIISRVAD